MSKAVERGTASLYRLVYGAVKDAMNQHALTLTVVERERVAAGAAKRVLGQAKARARSAPRKGG